MAKKHKCKCAAGAWKDGDPDCETMNLDSELLTLRAEEKAMGFNRAYPVGTKVQVWFTSEKKKPCKCVTVTKSEASVVGSSAVVWCENVRGCWALDSISVIAEERRP